MGRLLGTLLNLINIVIFFITLSLFASACFGTFRASIFIFLSYIVWLRITDEGSVPEMRIWSVLLMKSDLKWCKHLSRSLFLYLSCDRGFSHRTESCLFKML